MSTTIDQSEVFDDSDAKRLEGADFRGAERGSNGTNWVDKLRRGAGVAALAVMASASTLACGSSESAESDQDPHMIQAKDQEAITPLIQPELSIDRTKGELWGMYTVPLVFKVTALDNASQSITVEAPLDKKGFFDETVTFEQPVTGYKVTASTLDGKVVPISIPAQKPDGLEGNDTIDVSRFLEDGGTK